MWYFRTGSKHSEDLGAERCLRLFVTFLIDSFIYPCASHTYLYLSNSLLLCQRRWGSARLYFHLVFPLLLQFQNLDLIESHFPPQRNHSNFPAAHWSSLKLSTIKITDKQRRWHMHSSGMLFTKIFRRAIGGISHAFGVWQGLLILCNKKNYFS